MINPINQFKNKYRGKYKRGKPYSIHMIEIRRVLLNNQRRDKNHNSQLKSNYQNQSYRDHPQQEGLNLNHKIII